MKRACLAIAIALTCAPATAPAASKKESRQAKKLFKKGNKHLKKGLRRHPMSKKKDWGMRKYKNLLNNPVHLEYELLNK